MSDIESDLGKSKQQGAPVSNAAAETQVVDGFSVLSSALSRRSLLRFSLFSAMAFSTGCARFFGRKDAPEALAFSNLEEDEVRVITKLTRVLLPTKEFGLPSSIDEVPTVQNVDAMVSQMNEQTRSLMSLALWLFEHRPMASFRFSRFSHLSDEKAAEYVLKMQKGNFVERGLLTSLKTLITVNYWRDSRTWEGLEYWGPVTEKWGVRRLGNAPLPSPSV